MVGKLSRLPAKTQKALQQLACLGNSAELALLAMVLRRFDGGTARGAVGSAPSWLVRRLRKRLSVPPRPRSGSGLFADPAGTRAEAHLRIGRLLAAHTPPEKREEKIFEIVNQLNRGVDLINSRDEREQVAEFNLIAGKRAKASTAYASALHYLVAGAALLAETVGTPAGAPFPGIPPGRVRVPDRRVGGGGGAAVDTLRTRARTPSIRRRSHCLRIDLYTTLDRSDLAVEVGLGYLVSWAPMAPHPTEEEVQREYERTWSLLGGRAIEELIDLPLMTDRNRRHRGSTDEAVPAATFTDRNLLRSLSGGW